MNTPLHFFYSALVINDVTTLFLSRMDVELPYKAITENLSDPTNRPRFMPIYGDTVVIALCYCYDDSYTILFLSCHISVRNIIMYFRSNLETLLSGNYVFLFKDDALAIR